MIINPTIRDLILKGEDKKIADAIKIGFLEGMLDFTESFATRSSAATCPRKSRSRVAPNPEALKMALKGIKVATPGVL